MSNEIIEAFHRLFPSKQKTNARGWITFNCPACNDTRGRGGFVDTPTGGFRYRCQNGGCRYERVTGWEPDNPFLGRPRRLFELMGGSITDLPKDLVDPNHPKKPKPYDMSSLEARQVWIHDMQADWSPEAAATKSSEFKRHLEVALEFPEVKLPRGTVYLWDADTHDALDAQLYANDRCRFYMGQAPLLWCPRYSRYVIVPFIEKHKFIGWVARRIDDNGMPHIKSPGFPSDYMLNQHLRYRYQTVLVVESSFDALALRGLCTFGNVISRKQENLLNRLRDAGKRIVLIPDFHQNEWRDYWRTAKENSWYLSTPERWGGSDIESPEDYIKDPGESIKRHGLLYTIETIMNSITNNYFQTEIILASRSR